MTTITTWNARARWLQLALDAQDPDPRDAARQRLAQWRSLLSTCPSREIRAAAHPPGLQRGPAGEAVSAHRGGCLVLSSPVGDGKTTAMCWSAYHARGDVLWLDAVRIATARTDKLNRWLDQTRTAGLVLVDDVGAAGTIGQFESPKVAAILTAVAARTAPSIVSTNLPPAAFGQAYDSRAEGGRLRDRLAMRPNRWVTLPTAARSRREEAELPPGEDVLPPREAKAQGFLRAVDALAASAHAYVLADVDQMAIGTVAQRLGLATLEQLDQAVAEHAEGQARIQRAIADLAAKMRHPVLEDEPDHTPEPKPEEPGAAARRRVALLDLLAYTADRLGQDEADVLARLGRTRRTLVLEDEPALVALGA
jgi:hypothetical protein